MKILFFGDIVGRPGRETLKQLLPELKKELVPDLILANAENISHGVGVTEKTVQEMFALGMSVLTTGNHVWDKKEGLTVLEKFPAKVLRPANYPADLPGRGFTILEAGLRQVLIVNLLGRIFLSREADCPFRAIDKILAENKNMITIVDVHAEATSEKQAIGFYLDGRVSAVLGTHTHVATADQWIMPGGTAFISDVGMVGPKEAILGADKKVILDRFLKQVPASFDPPATGTMLCNAVFLEIDPVTRKTSKIERIDREIVI